MITMKQFEIGENLITESESGEYAYIIEKGKVEVSIFREGNKIYLNTLGEGETIGEMSMIEDRPHSATVTALEPTIVREIHRDYFFKALMSDPKIAIHILKSLFERLRNANNLIAQYEKNSIKSAETNVVMPAAQPPAAGRAQKITVILEGMTTNAVEALPDNPFKIYKFPFLIGRKSKDPLANNDLQIDDSEPLQVSRHHVSIIRKGDKIGALDRGSHLGTFVNEKRLGGRSGNPGPIFFGDEGGVLIVGDTHSLYKFKVSISRS